MRPKSHCQVTYSNIHELLNLAIEDSFSMKALDEFAVLRPRGASFTDGLTQCQPLPWGAKTGTLL
jgi:hypothetical protein